MSKDIQRILRSRRGSFILTREQQDDLGIENIQRIFGALSFMPFRAEHIFDTNHFSYSGYSPIFNNCHPGEKSKEYSIEYECINGEVGCIEVKEKSTGDLMLNILPEFTVE